MKWFVINAFLVVLTIQLWPNSACAAASEFDKFLGRFDYKVRDDMKIDSKGLVPLLATGKALLVDVRFKEEVRVWRTSFALNIPLNELPHRLGDLPLDKIIVVACPHMDRSAIAMAYLRSKGYEAKYLIDGLTGLAEYLRGERAKDFIEDLDKTKSNVGNQSRQRR